MRVMEIYLQEVAAFQFLSVLPLDCWRKVFALCDFFLKLYNVPRNFGLPTFQRQFGIFCGKDKIPGNDGTNGRPSTSRYPL